jgi:hypothetical protein
MESINELKKFKFNELNQLVKEEKFWHLKDFYYNFKQKEIFIIILWRKTI